MTIKNAAILLVLFFTDLKDESKTKEFVTINDFKDDVVAATKNADVVIFENESKNREVLLYNNDLDEEGAPAYEILAENTVKEQGVGVEGWREDEVI